MKDQDFKEQSYFKTSENWGDIEKIQWYHFNHLVQIRAAMDLPFVVHCCFELTGHSDRSDHGSKFGRSVATDGHFKTNLSLFDQWEKLEGIIKKINLKNFMKIGIYPEWNSPGFHIASSGSYSRWIQKNGEYFYGIDKIIKYFKK